MLLGAALAAAGPTGDPAGDLARRVESRHRSLTGLTAHFVQTYRSGVLGRTVVERGTLKIKPPGRMRWDYRDPEEKTFVSDGKTFYFYVPADRQVNAVAGSNTATVSDSIFSQYLIPFEIVSVLLLAALVGAIVIARKDR